MSDDDHSVEQHYLGLQPYRSTVPDNDVELHHYIRSQHVCHLADHCHELDYV